MTHGLSYHDSEPRFYDYLDLQEEPLASASANFVLNKYFEFFFHDLRFWSLNMLNIVSKV